MKARQVGHRLTLCSLTLAVLAVGWLEPSSLSYSLTRQAGLAGHAISVALAWVAIIGLLDVCINDLLAERWHMRWAAQSRHLGYIVLAVLHLSFVFYMARGMSLTWISAQYLLLAASAIWVACFDTYYHQREAAHA